MPCASKPSMKRMAAQREATRTWKRPTGRASIHAETSISFGNSCFLPCMMLAVLFGGLEVPLLRARQRCPTADHVGCFLGHHQDAGVDVRRHHVGHGGGINDTKGLHATDAEFRI